MHIDFTDKTILVTGGSRGIGRSMVETFKKLGANVYFTYNKNEDAAKEVAACGAKAVHCHQNNAAQIENTVDTIVEEKGTIDVLINNAGITSDQFIMMMPLEDWDKVIDTNLNGAFRWAKYASRPMIAHRSGSIINVASVSGLIGIGGQTNYAASKGGVIAFSRALAAELGPKGVRVNTIVPGYIETDMTAKMPRNIKRENVQRILLKRFGKPEEISEVAACLASEFCSYLTGQTITVDGGLTTTVV